MDSSIPDDYNKLLDIHLNLQKEFEDTKQTLHDSTRQLKVKESLIHEYQNEIEMLQSSSLLKYEKKISCLEETLNNLRCSNSQNTKQFENELAKKEQEKEKLKFELELLKRKNAALEQKKDVSLKLNETDNTAEYEMLKDAFEKLQESYQELLLKNNVLEQRLQEHEEEVNELKENLNAKREELLEKNTLIDKLNDDLLIINSELDNFKNKPLQEGSKGNSLFAEVNDRRVHLQKTVNDMKSNYIYLRNEYTKHEKIIARLRKENAELQTLWKKDLEEIQNDQEEIIYSLKTRIKLLEEMLERQRSEFEENLTPPPGDLCDEFMFYKEFIESKNEEIKKIEKKLSAYSITEHMLADSLAQANKKIRLMRLDMLEMQQQLDRNKEDKFWTKQNEICTKYVADNEDIVDKSKEKPVSDGAEDYEGSDLKSCLKPVNNLNPFASTSKKENLSENLAKINLENKENEEKKVDRRRGVKFFN